MKGHIRNRGKNSWAVVLDLGKSASGKRRQKWHVVHGTKKDALREQARLMNSINTGDYVEPTKTTVGDFLRRWLSDYAKVNVAGKTFERYQDIVRNDLEPSIGSLPLSKLQPMHILAYYSEALQKGRKDGSGGLSPTTVLQHHRILREALQHAVKWQLLGRNPADAVQPPRKAQREMRVLDEDETASLLHSAEGTRLELPILLAVTAGLRRGELLALRWSGVDLKAGSISVTQSIEQTRQGISFKPPKTRQGRRLVTVPQLAVEALRRHKVEQGRRRLELGPAYRDHDLVLAAPDGTPWNPSTFTAAFIALVRRPGMPRVRFHDLRHTHASQLLKQGIHAKITSARLGHSNVSITLDTYSHLMPGMDEDAALKIDAALRTAMEVSR